MSGRRAAAGPGPSVDHSAPWTGVSGKPGSAFLPPPAGFTPSGTAPFYQPGQGILWRYRRPHGSGGVRPVRVLSDDAQALVVWLAAGTEVVVAALPDGRPLRSVPAAQMFTLGRSARRTLWQGAGTLKVAPTGVPWSAWRFPSAPEPVSADTADPKTAPETAADGSAGRPRWTWYVNLEDPHCRDADGILTQELVLDVVVRPDGPSLLKDADELEAAVAAGRFPPPTPPVSRRTPSWPGRPSPAGIPRSTAPSTTSTTRPTHRFRYRRLCGTSRSWWRSRTSSGYCAAPGRTDAPPRSRASWAEPHRPAH